MTEIALITYLIFNIVCIFENILGICGKLDNRLSITQHGICISLDIAWILICACALYGGGSLAAAAITVATIYIGLAIFGDLFIISKDDACIYDGIGMATHLMLFVTLMAV